MPLKHNKKRLCLVFDGRQVGSLAGLAEFIGVAQSELIRRMYDHCDQDNVLNVLVPAMSGQWSHCPGRR